MSCRRLSSQIAAARPGSSDQVGVRLCCLERCHVGALGVNYLMLTFCSGFVNVMRCKLIATVGTHVLVFMRLGRH